jgi:transcriptional regulator with XRE-family HTH domain
VAFNGGRLAAARLAAGLTQEQLAAAISSSESRVSEWERGLFSPRPELIPVVAAAVGVPPLQLLDSGPAGPELESLRLAAGLSLQAIAAAAGTSVGRYRRMERGERLEDPDDLVRPVARVLSVRPAKVRAAIEAARKAAVVSGAVYLVYKAFSVGFEPQVIGIGSSRDQAVRLAEQHVDEEQYQWTDSGWSTWDVERLSRPALDFPDREPVEVWIQRVQLDQIAVFSLESDALVEEDEKSMEPGS